MADSEFLKPHAALAAALAVTLALLGIAAPAVGATHEAYAPRDTRAAFTVSAIVVAVARIEAQSAPAQLDLSAQDIRRGFKDVLEPTALTIRSNTPQGFALDLMTVVPMISALTVRGLGTEESLGADGGTLVQRGHGVRDMDVALTFRLMLVPGLQPGAYPWPLRIAVRPLDPGQ